MEEPPARAAPPPAPPSALPAHRAHWDAGAMGCGELVLELRFRVRALEAGEVLWLRALDPGAVEDIPAWCGMTGHPLLAARHPDYWIAR